MTQLNPVGKFIKGDTMLLHYLVRQPKVAIEHPPLLLLLHGVGGNEHNLFTFADQFPDEYLVVSARAPFEINPTSFKWFEVSFATGKPVIDAHQSEKSRVILLQFINQLKEKYEVDANQIYVGGFSQGAIMSFSIGLTRPDIPKGIIALSGRVLINEIRPILAENQKFNDLRALILHGKYDNVLPIDYARQSKALVEELKISHTYVELDIDHRVTDDEIQLINVWLKAK